MKRKFLIGLLCLTVLLVPGFAKAAGISASDITAANQANLKSLDESAYVNITVGNVRMLKSVSGGFIVLTFAESGGFTSDTYDSILTALKIILSAKNYNHFVSNYSSISDEAEVKFTGFRVKRNPTRLAVESQAFSDADILRVEICSNEFTNIPEPTPTPSNKPTPPSTVKPTPTPSVENPSTGDMNIVVVGAVATLAIAGVYLSVRKIRTN